MRPIQSSAPGLLAILASLLACSPADRSTSPSPTDGEIPFRSGSLIGATSGPVGPTVTTTGSGATVTGLTGRFTRLSFQTEGGTTDPFASTPVYYHAFSLDDLAWHIWRVNMDGSDPRQITFDSLGQRDPSFDPATHRIAYWQSEDGSGSTTLATLTYMQADGSGITPVRSEECQANGIRWAPNGTLIYGLGCEGAGLREIALDGTGNLTVFDRPFRGMGVANSAAGQFVLLARDTVGPDFTGNIYRINYPARDTVTLVAADGDDLFSDPQVSPVAPFRLSYWARDTGVYSLRIAPLADPANFRVIKEVPMPTFSVFPCHQWAPDGNSIVWSENGFNGESQIEVMDTLGQRIGFSITAQNSVGCPSVGQPEPVTGGGTVTLIGESGLFGPEASGVIFGQGTGGALQSIVAFRAAPQRSVKLETGTGLNSTAPVLTYSLQANRLNSLQFTGSPIGDSVISAIDSAGSPGATGALITFDATTGGIALILPFSSNAVGAEPVISDGPGVRTFQGRFLGVYRADGRNLAPGGAAEVTLDLRRRTPKVIR